MWLQSVAEPNGTGILAAIPGYHVAGKTGTADMANGVGGFYHHRTNATFVGFAPGGHPHLVMAVSLRGSTIPWNFGGIEAAPVFRITMEHALQQLDIPPDCQNGPTMKIFIKPGENLLDIAHKYGTSVRAIISINHLQHPSNIDSGLLLTIPRPRELKYVCMFQKPTITKAQAEIWSEGGG